MSSAIALKGILRLYSAATILHLHDNTMELTDQGVIYTTKIYNLDQLFQMFHMYRQKDYPALKHQFKRYKAKETADDTKPRNDTPVIINNLNWTLSNGFHIMKITDHSIGLLHTTAHATEILLNFQQPPTIGAIHRSLFLFAIGQFDQIVYSFGNEK